MGIHDKKFDKLNGEQHGETSSDVTAFSFGDPEPVLKNRLLDYLGVFIEHNGQYYNPPVSFEGLSKLKNANPHHGAMIGFKRNQLTKYFKPNQYISLRTFLQSAQDFAVFENAYFQVMRNGLGGVRFLRRLPAINMRRGVKPGVYFMHRKGKQPIEFKPGEVLHIYRADEAQSLYGVPEYYCGIQSVLLSEDSTLFRRKYYKNGAHMGYVFMTADSAMNEETEKKLQEALKNSKGPGNFSSLFINVKKVASGVKSPVEIIPIGDFSTKDEFESIKNISRGEILAMHRGQPSLAGLMPENTSGFGDIEKISRIYYENEVIPMQQQFLQLNDMLPRINPIAFEQPKFESAASN